jgi:hypothetical protein
LWSKPKSDSVTRIHKIFLYVELEITVLRQQPWNHIAVDIRELEANVLRSGKSGVCGQSPNLTELPASTKSSFTVNWNLRFYASSPGTTLP